MTMNTDDNEHTDKLTPMTEFRSNKKAKVVWKQYQLVKLGYVSNISLLNTRKIEKKLRNFLNVRHGNNDK